MAVPWARSLLLWFLIMLLESLLGTLRTLFLAPVIGDFPARRLGVVTGSVLVILITLLFFRWLRASTVRVQLRVGALWVILTVSFEVGLGRFVLGYDSARVWGDYDPSRGGWMGLGLLVMLLAPFAIGTLRSRRIERERRAA